MIIMIIMIIMINYHYAQSQVRNIINALDIC